MLIRLFSSSAGQPARELCYYIDLDQVPTPEQMRILRWLIAQPLTMVNDETSIAGLEVREIGPRLSIETAFSSNAVAICKAMGLAVRRIEMSRRVVVGSDAESVAATLDEMTEMVYRAPLTSFDSGRTPEPVQVVPILERGEAALREVNTKLGLGMDDWDIAYYTELFHHLGRNPTDVELFQIANGNSEHSRHWFFRGIQVINGVVMPRSLMEIVKGPWKARPGNSITAFHDNAGVIHGSTVLALVLTRPAHSSSFQVVEILQHITATAETHNHPTLIAPFQGATTGAGGRIRDNRAVGRGGLVHAGLAGYCVANLRMPGFAIPGEDVGGDTSRGAATPLEILIEGSNGISDYGNKVGEPLIGGFARFLELVVDGRRRGFRKPVLYSAGLGRVNEVHVAKRQPDVGMRIVRIGGSAYRVGVAGASASSMVHGGQDGALDLKSVQRGDAEVENCTNRVIQACAEMGDDNPIESIHDQGAGGPSNVLTELMAPLGGRVDIRKITLGDQTMSVLEIWVAEYQEGYGVLVRPENLAVFQAICLREGVNCEDLGPVTGDGTIVVEDSANGTTPVDLPLADILSEMPPKRFVSDHLPIELRPLVIPDGLTVDKALGMVFRLPGVGSKAFLTNKVDRSVGGLVARQQCCGPHQVPVADAAVTADGYFGLTGAAAALGEQPNVMLISPAAGARMAVAEMLTNLAGAGITQLSLVRCRANWMWAAKLPGQGALLYDAALALEEIMIALGIAIDGGKDSLSMATMVNGELVVSPGELVIMGYAPVLDITNVVTPDLKCEKGGVSIISLIDLGRGKNRLGGSSLAQALGQLGNDCPDIDDPDLLRRAIEAVLELVRQGIIDAYHDRSDGGLITTIAEMCIAGNCGARMHLPEGADILAELFTQEAGLVFAYPAGDAWRVSDVLRKHGVPQHPVSIVASQEWRHLTVRSGNACVFSRPIVHLRQRWEETSTQLELLQSNPETVAQERASHAESRTVKYKLSFTPQLPNFSKEVERPKVAVLREEGTNGDREMAAAFHMVGFEPWDITMSDLLQGRVTSFDGFRGLIFPGGFSYADVFGSAKGWAGPILFNPVLKSMFDRFYDRPDTFSLGVCNGCQLMANIGVVPWRGIADDAQPRLIHNISGRFESRWSAVRVNESPAIMLRGMAGSVMGIHVDHGEGRWLFRDSALVANIREQQLCPLVFVDVEGKPTEVYPYNPNGSPEGCAALCSPDGRNLAMMPHTERCFLPWQWPWMPEAWRKTLKASPWLQMFMNAYDWCRTH